jgi:hypothetical protein
MKKAFIYLLGFVLTITSTVYAQEEEKKDDGVVKKTGRTIKKGAKKVGHKTAELGSKGFAKVVDRTYDGKVAPNGRTVYITEDSRYYWVDKKGARHYVKESQLKDKQ